MALNFKTSNRLLDNLFEGIRIIDAEKRIIYWNRALEDLTGYSRETVLGKSCVEGMGTCFDEAGKSLCEDFCVFSKPLSTDEIRTIDKTYILHQDGYRKPVAVRIVPIDDDAGKTMGTIEIINDLSQAVFTKQLINNLRRLAMFDTETDLPNRRYFEHALNAKLAETARYGLVCGVLFIRIDHFDKLARDCGDSGDQIIRLTAGMLSNALRPFDVLCRWRGEFFVILVSNVLKQQLFLVGDRLREIFHQSTLTIASRDFKFTVSIGGAVSNANDTCNTMLFRAAKNMFHVRKYGGNGVLIEN